MRKILKSKIALVTVVALICAVGILWATNLHFILPVEPDHFMHDSFRFSYSSQLFSVVFVSSLVGFRVNEVLYSKNQ